MPNIGYNSLLRKCISGRFFPTFNLEQNQKADFIAAPFRRDLPQARRSQSRNEIYSQDRCTPFVEIEKNYPIFVINLIKFLF